MESVATPGKSVLGRKLLAALYYCGSSMTVQFMNKVSIPSVTIYESRSPAAPSPACHIDWAVCTSICAGVLSNQEAALPYPDIEKIPYSP